MKTRRRRLRVDMVGLTIAIGAMIVSVALIWFAGKLGEYSATTHQHEETLQR